MNINDNDNSDNTKKDNINIPPPNERENNFHQTPAFNNLFNEYSNIENEELINNLPQQQNLYEEEINYNIDSAKNKESQSSSTKTKFSISIIL